jgi:hypothetical protein
VTGPVPPSSPAMPPNLVRPPAARPSRRRGPLLLGVAAVVVVAVVVVVVAVILKTAGLTTGPGTATITWRLSAGGVHSPPTAFSGRADGLTLTGTAEGASPSDISSSSGTTGTFPKLAGLHLGRWTGTLGGTAFALDVTESVGTGKEPPVHNKFIGGFRITYFVTGTFGSQAVKMSATPDLQTSSIAFSGTVGNFTVKGTTTGPKENGKTGTLHASYTVTEK